MSDFQFMIVIKRINHTEVHPITFFFLAETHETDGAIARLAAGSGG